MKTFVLFLTFLAASIVAAATLGSDDIRRSMTCAQASRAFGSR